MAERQYDPEEAKRLDKPPIHFSLQDPWRDYRLSQHYTGNNSLIPPPPPPPPPLFPVVARTVAVAAVAGEMSPSRHPGHQSFAAMDDAAVAAKPLVSNIKRVSGVSKYRGVVWDLSSRAWRSKMKVKGKTWYLGLFKDDVSAAKAYDSASHFVYGLRANLNFPSIDYSQTPPPRAPPVWLMDYLRQVFFFLLRVGFYENPN